MVKLKELLSLRNMVYVETIIPKHEKRLHRKTPLFHEDIQLPLCEMPENDSKTTLEEVKYLASLKTNKEYVKERDDVLSSFKPLIETSDVSISINEIEKIIKQSVKYIFELKYKYNRPRPYQIAEFYDIDLNGTELDSMKTPSYPSGHAIQGYLIGKVLAEKDKTNAELYLSMGEQVADSRISAKAHYPSDKEYGKKVADVLYLGLKR